MEELLIKTTYCFIVFLELLMMVYFITRWIFRKSELEKKLYSALSPLLMPLEFLMKHSSLYTTMIDFSPIIAMLILVYLDQLVKSLL